MLFVQDLFVQFKKELLLEALAGEKGKHRRITRPEVHRPGLSLTGFLKNFVQSRILIFGRTEMIYLRQLDATLRSSRLEAILMKRTPCIIVTDPRPVKELVSLCEQRQIPLFFSKMKSTQLQSRLSFILADAFSPHATLHGSLVELFGVGVLVQGESSVGKSEAALGLIERGHRLISDDVVRIRKKDHFLIGSGPELTQHLMEIRGIGIINVAHLYGAVCVRSDKSIDVVVQLEEWNDNHFYDRLGLDEKEIDILGARLPLHILPVKPGRDVVLLIETIALNHRLKDMGTHSAKEFNEKLLKSLGKINNGSEIGI